MFSPIFRGANLRSYLSRTQVLRSSAISSGFSSCPNVVDSSSQKTTTTNLDYASSALGRHAGKLYKWNDILFASSFNEIIKLDPSQHDLSQYSMFREKNFIKSFDKGFFSFLPFLVRAYERLVRLVDHEMQSAGCQKIIMPSIVGKHLWMKSERWETSGEEVFRLRDRHKNIYCLAPTQEETVTQILASIKQLSYRQLPLYLYQITPKFRDEIRTKYGLLRAREFVMKDLYTFDRDDDAAKETYDKICRSYEAIFRRLELPVLKTVGSVGLMGGKYSHEWLLETPLGEDEVYTCLKCNESFNAELVGDLEATGDEDIKCLNCKRDQLMPKNKALELGHSFLLGDRYSSKMNGFYLSEHTNKPLPLQMGCYGLGMSRILAGSVEYLSQELPENIEIMNARASAGLPVGPTPQTSHIRNNIISIRWPKLVVPFKICLILPKRDSKEDRGKGTEFSMHLANVINERFGEDILLDDRSNLTIGKRLLTAKAIGVPFVIVAGRNILDAVPKFEVWDTYSSSGEHISSRKTHNGSAHQSSLLESDRPSNSSSNNRQPVLLTQCEVLEMLDTSLGQYQL